MRVSGSYTQVTLPPKPNCGAEQGSGEAVGVGQGQAAPPLCMNARRLHASSTGVHGALASFSIDSGGAHQQSQQAEGQSQQPAAQEGQQQRHERDQRPNVPPVLLRPVRLWLQQWCQLQAAPCHGPQAEGS